MILIVGLGNPGPKYSKTRHNLGFMVLDKLAKKLLPGSEIAWKKDEKINAEILEIDSQKLILAKPQTFVNASGFAVTQLTRRYPPAGGLDANQLFVVHDDLDLPLGKIKISKGGGAAGHKGIKSIIDQLGTQDFVRFRLGIAKFGEEVSRLRVEEFVLSEFDFNELGKARIMIKKAVEAIEVALKDGLERAMNKFN